MTHQVRPSDEELWSSIAAGDELAFGRLFDRYSRPVYNHAFRLTGSWSTAEDVTQATFLVAWRRRHDARLVDGSALPWLLVIATDAVRSEWRSARRWLALLRRLPDSPPPASGLGLARDLRRGVGQACRPAHAREGSQDRVMMVPYGRCKAGTST
ncbi:sigma factor [Micromonospora sp. NPDC050495]|uniref:RNA polymerase sigma factor n=1 Tax=Micromonospora sp. NPDC050495 TaxID=3154936 RepID=UPI0033C0FE68